MVFALKLFLLNLFLIEILLKKAFKLKFLKKCQFEVIFSFRKRHDFRRNLFFDQMSFVKTTLYNGLRYILDDNCSNLGHRFSARISFFGRMPKFDSNSRIAAGNDGKFLPRMQHNSAFYALKHLASMS